MRYRNLTSATAVLLGVSMAALGAHAAGDQKTAAAQSGSGLQQVQSGDTKCPKNWNVVDSNGDGSLNRSELDKAVDAQFSAIDLNKDGSISETEYADCHGAVKASAPGNGQSDWKDYSVYGSVEGFGEADTDKSNDISRKEAAAVAAMKYDESKHGTKEEHARANAHGFDSLDRDGNDKLSLGEWLGRHADGTAEGIPAGGFVEADTDSSGAISEQEYRAAVGDMNTQPAAEADVTRDDMTGTAMPDFATADTDKDSQLSRSEWESAMSGTNVTRAFRQIDSDHDGKITKQEWKLRHGKAFERSASAQGSSAQADGTQSSSKDAVIDIWYYYIY